MSGQLVRSAAVGAAHSVVDVLGFKGQFNMAEAKRFAAAAVSDYATCQAVLAWYPEGYGIWQPVMSGAAYVAGDYFLRYDGMPMIYQFLIQAGASYAVPPLVDRFVAGASV